MAYLRINLSGRLNKPIPSAISTKLPALQTKMANWATYAQKINAGEDNEEDSVKVSVDNQPGWVDFALDLAIPEDPSGVAVLQHTDDNGNKVGGIQIDSTVASALASIRSDLRELKGYLVKNSIDDLMGDIFICHHDSNGVLPDEPRTAI